MFLIVPVLSCLSLSAIGQGVSASSVVSAKIVNPVQIGNVRDMDFGIIAAGVISGSVVLDPNAASTRSASGGVTLPPGSSTVQSAKFIVSGEDNQSFSIVLPASILLSNGVQSMIADSFTSVPSVSGVFTSGSQTIYVGATLHVNALQEPGIYHTTENFEVTISYN